MPSALIIAESKLPQREPNKLVSGGRANVWTITCKSKLANADLSDKEMEAVERLSRGIVNKLLHGPMAHLRKTESIEGKQATLKELSAMFRLEEAATGRKKRIKRRNQDWVWLAIRQIDLNIDKSIDEGKSRRRVH